MKKIILVSVALVLGAVVTSYAAWMTNVNHHCQVRVPDGWNTESEIIIKGDKHAHLILAAPEPEKEIVVAAILSMEVERQISLEDFKKIFEYMLFKNAKLIEQREEGHNNLKGIYAEYDAEFGGKPYRLMCFFTQKDQFLYGVFTGALQDKFDEKKSKLEEILATIQYVKNP